MRVILSLLLTLALLIVGSVYVAPEWLKQRQINAAAADVTMLLAEEPLPDAALRSGYAALMLLPYRVDEADYPQLMLQYGAILTDADQPEPPALTALRLLPEDEPQWWCRGTTAECLADMDARLPEYQAAAVRHRALLQRMDALVDYDVLYSPLWPNAQWNILSLNLAPLMPLLQSRSAALLEWKQNNAQAALRRSCRQVKLGRMMLGMRPGVVYSMMGNALIRDHVDVVAHILAAKPALAARLPEDCQAVFSPLSSSELSLCRAVKDEYRLVYNMGLPAGADALPSSDNGVDSVRQGWHDREHSEARKAPYYAAFCKDEFIAALEQDRPARIAVPDDGWREKWACLGNFIGCFYTSAETQADLNAYQNRLLDTQMQLRAQRAALAWYRLPEQQRTPAALVPILAQHSSPERQLVWDERQKHIRFEPYFAKSRVNNQLPLGMP